MGQISFEHLFYRYQLSYWRWYSAIETCRVIINEKVGLVHHYGAGGSMHTCHATGPASIPGQNKFPGRGFFLSFSSPVKQMPGNFRPTRSPNVIWPSQSFFHIRLVTINGCVNGVYRLFCSCCLGGGPGIGLITHPGRHSMSFFFSFIDISACPITLVTLHASFYNILQFLVHNIWFS